tara:strand:- start:217 stop:405 length:189 start_codon:yes stop_codon:yes gene_type:complete
VTDFGMSRDKILQVISFDFNSFLIRFQFNFNSLQASPETVRQTAAMTVSLKRTFMECNDIFY